MQALTHRVQYYETDQMGCVHHSNYIRWFEIGRVEYLRSIGITLDMLMDDGYVFPITEVRAKYLSPGHFDEELLIDARLEFVNVLCQRVYALCCHTLSIDIC